MKMAVFSAIKNDDPDAIGALLEAGADANDPDILGSLLGAGGIRSSGGLPPLQLACRNGAGKVVASLLKAGAQVEPSRWPHAKPVAFRL